MGNDGQQRQATDEKWEGLFPSQTVASGRLSSQAASHRQARCYLHALVGKSRKISMVLECNNKSCRAVGTTIYGIIKVNVMALDSSAYNLPFNRSRESSVSKRKLDNLIFISIHAQACSGAHPWILLCSLKYGPEV